MNHKNSTSLALKIILVAFVIFSGIYCYKAHNVTVHNNHVAQQERVAINNSNNTRKHMTRQQAVRDFVAHRPNLAIVEKDVSNRVNKGIVLACTHLHSKSEIAKNAPTIKAFLGSNVGSTLISNTEVTSMGGGQTVQQSNKFLGKKISFGKYDDSTSTLPMDILIKYQTSPYINGSGNVKGFPKQRSTYYEEFRINIKTYNTYNIKLHVVGHARSQNGQKA